MHILHIANSYGGTEVYTQLIKHLDQLGVRQTVYVPLNVNNRNRVGNLLIKFNVKDSIIIYSTKLEQIHRFVFDLKIKVIVSDIEKLINIDSVDLIHAGLFCTDGAAAYEISKKTGIPFIVAVRNTDVNFYYKNFWWKIRYFNTILRESRRIIFISYQYKQNFLELLHKKGIRDLDSKSIVIPNGLNAFFFENRSRVIKKLHSPVRIVFAGAFNKGKNIIEIINALSLLVEKGYSIDLSLIGKGLKFRKEDNNYLEKIYSLIKTKPWIKVLNSLPKEQLMNSFREHDIFIMPSVPETFGIVYLEALSQGLPIIFAKGQGFDGYYNHKNIGFGVDANNSKDIALKIEYVINNYEVVSKNVYDLDLYEDFSWEKISEQYYKIYKLNVK